VILINDLGLVLGKNQQVMTDQLKKNHELH